MTTEIQKKINNIKYQKLSIYDNIEIGDPNLWLTSEELESCLNEKLIGMNLNYAIRTRSRIIKQEICKILNYPVPSSFKRTNPRFVGQLFDVYVQKSNNLQIWNEELSLERRYVLIKVNENEQISKVKVVSGADLAPLDTTGKLTQKYQACLISPVGNNLLVNIADSPNISPLCKLTNTNHIFLESPIAIPTNPSLLFPINVIFNKLQDLIGKSFKNPGKGQERNRGAELHKLVCKALGYQIFQDNGQFPDIKHQLLEVKLQTSPTIDLGLVTPSSTAALDINKIEGIQIEHSDVRYAIFYANLDDEIITIKNFVLVSGKDFFKCFRLFEGKKLNTKIQIPLPLYFFN